MDDNLTFYLTQIRECYGNITYSHKAQLKQIDIYRSKDIFWNIIQIILAVVLTGSFFAFLGDIFGCAALWKVTTFIFALSQTIIGLCFLKINYEVEIIKLEQSSTQLLGLREEYQSLIVDIMAGTIDIDNIKTKRDILKTSTQNIYLNSPSISQCAYKRAKKGIEKDGEFTFTNNEIDNLLPENLRLNKAKE